MKDLKPEQVEEIAGGFDPKPYESELAPEPQPDVIVIDYNPDRAPK